MTADPLIQNAIQDIQRLIKWRETLRDNKNQELDDMKTRLKNYLGEMFFGPGSWKLGVSDLHVLTHKTILEIEKAIPEERAQTWRDLQDLYRELRQLEQEKDLLNQDEN